MENLYSFGLTLIAWLQTLSPALDSLMNLFSFLGRTEFYLLIIPFIYWSVNPSLGIRTLVILISADLTSSVFKLIFHQPRPYWVGNVQSLSIETTYGIPSGHASDSLAFWGYLATKLKKRWLSILALVLIVMIALSRLYLGVHFPQDIVFGWLIGVTVLWVFSKVDAKASAWISSKSLAVQLGLAFLLSLAVIAIGQIIKASLAQVMDPQAWSALAAEARSPNYSFSLSGALFGGLAGYALMKRYARFKADGSWPQRIGRYALGAIGVVAIFFGLDILFASMAADETVIGYVLRFLRYGTVSSWVTFFAPWIFLKLKLAKRV